LCIIAAFRPNEDAVLAANQWRGFAVAIAEAGLAARLNYCLVENLDATPDLCVVRWGAHLPGHLVACLQS
jgi:hypothetical protein